MTQTLIRSEFKIVGGCAGRTKLIQPVVHSFAPKGASKMLRATGHARMVKLNKPENVWQEDRGIVRPGQ